jgi:glycosyltransferase involved in cell wall biosynthesis
MSQPATTIPRVPQPLVSVVVSTYERPQRLARLLAALRTQTLEASRYEVVVVDNGSGPATAAVLQAELARGELPLRTVRHERTLGPAGGRNSGWRAAAGPLIAFTDDDCVPAPGWLEAGLGAAGAPPRRIVQGRTEPDPSELTASALTSRTVRITGPSPQYETCNIFYPRSLLDRVGGFDESFGLRPAGEDTELAWRAIADGAEVTYEARALVHHAVVQLGLIGTLRDATRWGGCARMFARAPQTRAILYGGRFWNVWHFLLVRSALSLLGPPWLRRLVLRRHAQALRERARRAGAGGWAVGYLALYDLIETLAMARGAVRHRTLVL